MIHSEDNSSCNETFSLDFNVPLQLWLSPPLTTNTYGHRLWRLGLPGSVLTQKHAHLWEFSGFLKNHNLVQPLTQTVISPKQGRRADLDV